MSIKVKINNDWVDTNIKAVRGVNHVNSEDAYTKEEIEKKFATKTEVQTQIDNSITKENIENIIGEVYTKTESDALLATKQNVLTAGNGVTITDDVISVDAMPVDNKKFTVWSNPRIDEYVTTFTNFGYNDDGTQKTSGSSTRSWVFKIGNYVKAMFITNQRLDTYLQQWLKNVSPTGTFVKNKDATWGNTDAGIPTGWTVETV